MQRARSRSRAPTSRACYALSASLIPICRRDCRSISARPHRLVATGLTLRALSGTCGVNKISGDLTYSAEKGVTGTLQTEALSLGTLLQLALGPARTAKRSAVWSEAPFAPPMTLPPALIALHVGSLGLTSSVVAQDADFNLMLAPNQFGLQHFSAKLGAGSYLR